MKVKTSSEDIRVRKPGFRVLTVAVAAIIACTASTTVFAYGDSSTKKSSGTTAEKSVVSEVKNFFNGTFTVKINSDGKNKKVKVSDGTVADALDKAGITLGEEDKVSPSLETPVNSYTKIKITRVKYKTKVEKETIKYDTKIILCDDMSIGQTEIVKEGVNGTKAKIYTQKLVDDVVTETVFSKEIIKKKPVTEIKKVGTKKFDDLASYKGTGYAISELEVPSSLKLDKNGVPTNYKYVINGKATAYTGDTATSTGRTPMPGHIAVDPKEIPYGTALYITSADGKYVYGYSIAADTGGFVKMGNTDIDLFMNNEQMCLDWGNRKVKIYVLG